MATADSMYSVLVGIVPRKQNRFAIAVPLEAVQQIGHDADHRLRRDHERAGPAGVPAACTEVDRRVDKAAEPASQPHELFMRLKRVEAHRVMITVPLDGPARHVDRRALRLSRLDLLWPHPFETDFVLEMV